MSTKLSYRKRRQELKQIIQEQGTWVFNKTQLAEKYKISRTQLYKDLDIIINEIPKEKINEIRLNINVVLKFSLKNALRIVLENNDNPELQLKGIHAIDKICNSIIGFISNNKNDFVDNEQDVQLKHPGIVLKIVEKLGKINEKQGLI